MLFRPFLGAHTIPFDFLSLFKNGNTGAWYDLTATDTTFQTIIGRLGPVGEAPYPAATTTGQDVAFALDKSEGATYDGTEFQGLGGEEVSNGDFSNGTTNWLSNRGAALSESGGVLTVTGTGTTFSEATQTLSLTEDRYYLASSSLLTGTGLFRLSDFGVSTTYLTRNAPAGVPVDYRYVVNPGSPSVGVRLGVQGATDTTTWDNVSVKELPGSHAHQETATSVPTRNANGSILGDGVGTYLGSHFAAGSSGCIAVRMLGSTASRTAFGANGASVGLDASGRVAAEVGSDGYGTIFGGSDVRGSWVTVIVNWDGSNVQLYVDGTSVYSGAQNGNPAGLASYLLANNNSGTANNFWDGSLGAAIIRTAPISATTVAKITAKWASIT